MSPFSQSTTDTRHSPIDDSIDNTHSLNSVSNTSLDYDTALDEWLSFHCHRVLTSQT